MTDVRFEIPACPIDDVLALERELGVSHVLAQVLARRGLADPADARRFLDSGEEHDPDAFAGMAEAVELILGHVQARTRITVHGDYDVDGVCSTAVLVRALRALGADVDSYLPDRERDGYGLNPRTVERLAERGTRLLVTADCAITAVDEVAAARALGLDVVVTDHHSPRADGRLPVAPIVHPAVCGYPCTDLCATAVAHKLALALHRAAGADPRLAAEDLDLVALATVADVVPLIGENRRLVRSGLRALAATAKPGLRALMAVARVDPSRLDARALGFRLAPRINAAGRLYRADAGLELVLTEDPARAAQIAEELDRANVERRHTETRILFEAEAQVAELGDRHAYVLSGEGWHPGVIGIVASRVAERHHRPALLIALDGDSGRGSGRSIRGFDLLAGLDACAEHLLRHGGHRAAAGLEIERARVDDLARDFEVHARGALSALDLLPSERVDAIVSGDELGTRLAEELERLEPCGQGNPSVSLMLPAARFSDPRAMGEGRHVRFTVESGGLRSQAVSFGTGGRLPVADGVPVDATFTLELNEWNGAVEPRLVMRSARVCAPAAIELVGEPSGFLAGVWGELEAALPAPAPSGAPGAQRSERDRRGHGVAGTLVALVAGGEPVLVVGADATRRREHLAERLGGFALCSYAALAREPALAASYRHLFLLDPPALGAHELAARSGEPGQMVHLGWGEPELRFSVHVHDREYGLRAALTALYRALREAGGARGEALEAVLRGDSPPPRSPALAGRLLRVLEELGLVELDRERSAVTVTPPVRTALERSAAFRSYEQTHQDGLRFLKAATARAA